MNPKYRSLALGAIAIAWATTAASAAIIQEGGVAISPGLIDVGLIAQQGGDGLLVVTPPSILAANSMNIGIPQSFPSGISRVRLEGGRINLSELLLVGRAGHGVLDVSSGGQLDAAIVRIGGQTAAGPIATQGTATVDGDGSVMRYRNTLVVGNTGDGVLSVMRGGAVIASLPNSQPAVIGQSPGSSGRVVVDGEGSLWQHNGEIQVAGGGAGSLDVTNGAVVLSLAGRVGGGFPGAAGVVSIDGPGSRWSVNTLQVGGGGSAPGAEGEIRVSGGGVLDSSAVGQAPAIGGPSSLGRMIVNGPQSRWLVGTAPPILGRSQGTAELHLENGTLFTSSGADMTQGSSARVVVSGAGTRWHSTGAIRFGEFNRPGVIEVRDGATIQLSLSGALQVGASGRLVLDGGRIIGGLGRGNPNVAGVIEGSGRFETSEISTTSTSRILVGEGDRLEFAGHLQHAGLTAINGGEMVVSRFTNVASGRVRAEDATIRIDGIEPVANNAGTITFVSGRNRHHGVLNNTGTLSVVAGAEAMFYDTVTNAGVMSASSGSQVTMLGTLRGRGVGGDGHVSLEGIVQPGGQGLPPVSEMRFGGDVALGGASRLELDFSGGTRERLTADGAVSLDGTLQLTVAGGIAGSQTLPIVTAGELIGTFAQIPALNAHLGAGVRFGGIDYDYDQDEVRVNLLQGLAGDFNLDGAVDGGDFLVWQQQLGSPAAAVGLGADADCNGLVDVSGLELWRADIRAAARGALQPSQTAIPEPGAVTLMLLAMATLNSLRRPRAGVRPSSSH
jgi:T5SS/PEP-CTERM-associated repeat protein